MESQPTNRRRLPFWRIRTSRERRNIVLEDIEVGSAPRPIYYFLLGVSVLIAGFGLLQNSPAVVIGAMLVSPLMMPIFGVSVGLSRADYGLLRNAMLSEFGGVILAIFLSYLLGLLPLSFTATPEMLARTSPTLVDLFVAALAGLAGCLAMIDERISPALPGVAIATALTPPLATCGLCLAFGIYSGAWGAFLLFFANFLAILAAATTVFLMAGFVSRAQMGTRGNFAGRFAGAAAGLVLVTVLLTNQLIILVENRRTAHTIRTVLDEAFADEPNVSVRSVVHDEEDDGRLAVLSVVRTSRVLSPLTVRSIEKKLSQALEEPVDLFFRCSLTKDVGATGTASMLAQLNLDGSFGKTTPSPDARIIQVAEQTVRDLLVNRPSIMLRDINLIHLPIGPVVVASVQSPSEIIPRVVSTVQEQIRERVGDPRVVLVVRAVDSLDITGKGRVLFGSAHFDTLPEPDATLATELETHAQKRLEALPHVFAPNVDAVKKESGWAVRAEVIAPEVPTPTQVRRVEDALKSVADAPVDVTVWASTNIVVTGENYSTLEHLIEADVIRRGEKWKQATGTDAEEAESAAP